MSQATAERRQRRHLHFDALIQGVRRRLQKLPEQRRCPTFSLADTQGQRIPGYPYYRLSRIC